MPFNISLKNSIIGVRMDPKPPSESLIFRVVAQILHPNKGLFSYFLFYLWFHNKSVFSIYM